jgi:hypothetical protein
MRRIASFHLLCFILAFPVGYYLSLTVDWIFKCGSTFGKCLKMTYISIIFVIIPFFAIYASKKESRCRILEKQA